ncbi:MAG TPA: cytochrome c peroxidase [Bacteroidia bacterium]|nr:cytochrome c peroxidase [Bacteroidia bacterium]
MRRAGSWGWGIALWLLSLPACAPDRADMSPDSLTYPLEIPAGFPQMPIPADNYLTPDRVALGKRLFYDPILSREGSVACASCHLQENGFADTTQFSRGIDGRMGFRNAPTLSNLAWHPYFFMDGGVPTLELQVLAPLDNHDELDLDLISLMDRLQSHPQYPALFRKAYGREPDPFGLTRAIAAFERTLVSGNSAYDRQVLGQDSDAMSPAAVRGMALFFGDRLHCAGCHSGFDFTDYGFHNIGLPVTTADSGRMRITLNENDRGSYKTPSLRNVALSAPYMHDGSIRSLEEVIDFLASGGAHYPNQHPLTQGFAISSQEKTDLIAFLHALTDTEFITRPEFGK